MATAKDPNSDPKVDMDAEFPTDWHKQAHIESVERELEGAKLRGDKEQADNAARELARLSKKTSAKRETRPKSDSDKETA